MRERTGGAAATLSRRLFMTATEKLVLVGIVLMVTISAATLVADAWLGPR